MSTKPFSFNMNLDDEQEVATFLDNFNSNKGRQLANEFGWTGTGSSTMVTLISHYAWNKSTAISCRLGGDIPTALSYEAICDKIYKQLTPLVELW